MRLVAVDSDALTFTTYRKSAKVRNLERDLRVCVFAVHSAGGHEHWVSVEGQARVFSPGEDQIERLFGGHQVVSDDAEGRVPDSMRGFVARRLRDGKRVLVEVIGLRCKGICKGETS
jgi:hypothetical protein